MFSKRRAGDEPDEVPGDDAAVDDAVDDASADSVEASVEPSARDDAAPEGGRSDEGVGDDPAGDDPAEPEPSITYRNAMYRLVSIGGAGLIAILGITGFTIGRTLDPIPPPQFFIVDGVLTVILFGWYLLGMRCRLELSETQVHVATKYGDFRVDRDRIVSVEADRSIRGTLQWSGRPLIITYRPEGSDDVVKTRRGYGCLPNDAAGQERVVAELQGVLGAPEDGGVVAAGHVDTSLSDAVAARLATMTPEGEAAGPHAPDPEVADPK
ncbi:MAG: hypothetical protein JST73_08745 [Actinobacteria bacterium]|nr:hypothetical protein [Actinomycetota bacterium]